MSTMVTVPSKLVDLTTNSIVANITVNSTERANEMAYDATLDRQVFVVQYARFPMKQDDETLPRVGVISENRTVRDTLLARQTHDRQHHCQHGD